jgi:hypothetical protein
MKEQIEPLPPVMVVFAGVVQLNSANYEKKAYFGLRVAPEPA